MRDDDRGNNEKTGSPDRKTRVDGDRVIHTTAGAVYHGDAAERPRGLTTEQANNQTEGWNVKEQQARDDGARAKDAPPHHVGRNATDELTEPPYGKKNPRQ
ncbi:MAG TPA: hypothetical protein VJ032_01060 [Thermoanaerobaculia bacterium]|nr:hypothetical protein [Thermoanaerobaculia bacterium]